MVIKNKDGSVYKINQPNPIMLQQDKWDDFTLHNMEFEGSVVDNNAIPKAKPQKLNLGSVKTIKIDTKEEPPPTPPIKKPVVEVEVEEKDDFEIPDFSKEDNNIPEPTPVSEEQVLKPSSINQKLKLFKKDVMHCMLADTKETVDPLYEEKKIKVSYIRTFTFENIIIKEDDMQLVFWSHLDFLTKNSVLYPKNNTRRWWKIDNIKRGSEGAFFSCIPTNVQPSFSG